MTLSTLFYRAYLSIISITESNKEQTGNKKKRKEKQKSVGTHVEFVVGWFFFGLSNAEFYCSLIYLTLYFVRLFTSYLLNS